jgi:hypothetical protein
MTTRRIPLDGGLAPRAIPLRAHRLSESPRPLWFKLLPLVRVGVLAKCQELKAKGSFFFIWRGL